MVTCEEFAKVILHDARSVQSRQDSDSIDIIDNIRYHVAVYVQTFSEIQSVQDKLTLIDNLLDSLGLDC